MEQVEEVVSFLASPRADVRAEAAKVVLSLTGTDGGIVMLSAVDGKDTCTLLARMLGDSEPGSLHAANALVNMTTNERVRDDLAERPAVWSHILERLGELRQASSKVSPVSRTLVKLLNNLTTTVPGAQRFLAGRLGPDHPGYDLRILLNVFLRAPSELPEAAMVLTNMTRLDEGRAVVLDRKQSYLAQLVALLRSDDLAVRRGVVDTVRNCCFAIEDHRRMTRHTPMIENLILPLVGPEGVASQDDLDELPELVQKELARAQAGEVELQIEPDEGVRKAIIDTFLLLCTTRAGRCALRDKHIYSIIKVYHAEETNEDTNEAVFKLVDFLLGEEEAEETEAEVEEAIPASADKEGVVEAAAEAEPASAAAPNAPSGDAAPGAASSGILFELD